MEANVVHFRFIQNFVLYRKKQHWTGRFNGVRNINFPWKRNLCYRTRHINEAFTFYMLLKTKTKLRGLSPRTNYTDRATAPVGEVTANFCWWRVTCGQRDGFLRPYSRFSRPEPLLYMLLYDIKLVMYKQYTSTQGLFRRGWIQDIMSYFSQSDIHVAADYVIHSVTRPVCVGVRLSSGAHDQIFVFRLTIAGFLMWGTLSDERICFNLLVQLLLGLTRAVTLGSKSRKTHDHILLSHLRLPQL
jgi:hypothetical protein